MAICWPPSPTRSGYRDAGHYLTGLLARLLRRPLHHLKHVMRLVGCQAGVEDGVVDLLLRGMIPFLLSIAARGQLCFSLQLDAGIQPHTYHPGVYRM